MNFLKSKNFWIGALILASIAFAVWLGCGCFLPQARHVRPVLSILAVFIALIFFIFTWLNQRKWPWQISWREWKDIIKEEIDGRSR